MDTLKALELDDEDIPPADDRDEDEDAEGEEPPDLYHVGDPGPMIYDASGVAYEQPSVFMKKATFTPTEADA